MIDLQRPPKDPDSVSRTFLKQYVLVPLVSLIIARNTSRTNNTRTNTSWPVKVPLKHKSQHGQWKCTPGNGNVTHIRQQIRPPQSAALVISWWGTGSTWRQPCNSNQQCKTVLSQTLQLCTLSQFSAQFIRFLFFRLATLLSVSRPQVRCSTYGQPQNSCQQQCSVLQTLITTMIWGKEVYL